MIFIIGTSKEADGADSGETEASKHRHRGCWKGLSRVRSRRVQKGVEATEMPRDLWPSPDPIATLKADNGYSLYSHYPKPSCSLITITPHRPAYNPGVLLSLR